VLSELEQVCDWLIVVDHGALVFQGPASELGHATNAIVAVPEHAADLPRLELLLNAAGHDSELAGGELVITVNGSEPRRLAADVNRAASAQGIVLAELGPRRTTLEERYLAIVNGADR
jgi:ABC-2 type transport system ATP-binding protein